MTTPISLDDAATQLEGRTMLVTGANGFVGTRISRRLASHGATIRALVRRPGSLEELRVDGIEEYGGDFMDPSVLRGAVQGVDAVVHCAATGGVDLADARRVNVEGTRAVVEAVRAAPGARLVHISTGAVYAPSEAGPLDEDAPLTTDGHQYAVTKAEADGVVLEAVASGVPATILRPVAILGMHPTSVWAIRVPERVRDGSFELTPDLRFRYVHVENLVDAVLLALVDDGAVGRVYNVVDGSTSMLAFTDEIRAWFDAPPLPVAPPRPALPELSSDRIRRELGYDARRSYEDGMAEAAAHWATVTADGADGGGEG